MLRVHFSAGDLGRVRIAPGVDPLWETVLSLQRLQTRSGALVFDGWLRATRRRLTDRRQRNLVHVLSSIAPRQRYFPDFLTPAESRDGFESGMDAVLSTPRPRLTAELEKVCRYGGRPMPPWMSRIARSERHAMSSLGTMLAAYYRAAIVPHLAQVEQAVAADRAVRSQAITANGAEGLFASLGPDAVWDANVLQLPYPCEVDIRLDGRGVTFVPSYFCWGKPVALSDKKLPPVVVYPIEHPVDAWHTCGHADRRLGSLLGRTRAEMLWRIADGASSSELAAALDVTPGAVTHHTAVLREAGIIVTTRDGRFVRHAITPLGAALLRGFIR
ncbi:MULTISPECIES: helix-turn-helix domain-containing protein [unclassified Kribbella]|uniref:ArsR/SmtB family transcription factor n=1 Tax=unclassified Kribbella TaxID=2644121 RepID=UPI00340C973B